MRLEQLEAFLAVADTGSFQAGCKNVRGHTIYR